MQKGGAPQFFADFSILSLPVARRKEQRCIETVKVVPKLRNRTGSRDSAKRAPLADCKRCSWDFTLGKSPVLSLGFRVNKEVLGSGDEALYLAVGITLPCHGSRCWEQG
jgi:hypothetical protein